MPPSFDKTVQTHLTLNPNPCSEPTPKADRQPGEVFAERSRTVEILIVCITNHFVQAGSSRIPGTLRMLALHGMYAKAGVLLELSEAEDPIENLKPRIRAARPKTVKS